MDSRPLERETKENEPENIRKQYIVPAIDRLLPPLLPPLPSRFPNRPGTSYINIWLPTVFEGMMQREPLTEAKDTGCFLPNIAFVRFISSLLPYPSSIPSSSTNRKIFLLGGKLRLSPDVEEMNFFLTNIYARWGRREKLPVLEMLDVLSDNKRSVVGRSSTG